MPTNKLHSIHSKFKLHDVMAQGSRRFSPDPSPRERVGSGDETTIRGDTLRALHGRRNFPMGGAVALAAHAYRMYNLRAEDTSA